LNYSTQRLNTALANAQAGCASPEDLAILADMNNNSGQAGGRTASSGYWLDKTKKP